MKVKILKIVEQHNTLYIYTECKYGKTRVGLSLDAKYLDPVTQKPKYLKEVKELLENKYEPSKATPKNIHKKEWNKEIDLDKI